MMRKAAAVLSCSLLVSCLWGGSVPIGSVDLSQGAAVAGAEAIPGTTIFEGETLTVPAGGTAAVVFRGGSRVAISANSRIRLLRQGSHFAVRVERGGVEISESRRSPVEGLLNDVSFGPASQNAESAGWIGFAAHDRPVLYAEKGAWIVTTAHDGRSAVLHPGQELKGKVSADPKSKQNPQNKRKRGAVIWIGTALVGTATGLALAYGMSECTVVDGGSPRCGHQKPVASPVTP